MFALRLLVALCAAPLVMAAFVGVAYLGIHVHPLYDLLFLVCVALAAAAGRHMHHHFEDQGTGPHAFATGIVLVAAGVAAYVVTLNLVAPRHMCTVVESYVWKRHTPGGRETHSYRRLACDDGRTDWVGSKLALNGVRTNVEHHGTRLLVAYDPNGRLPSLVIRGRGWWMWVVGAGIGMAVAVTTHVGVVTADRRRRLRRPGRN